MVSLVPGNLPTSMALPSLRRGRMKLGRSEVISTQDAKFGPSRRLSETPRLLRDCATQRRGKFLPISYLHLFRKLEAAKKKW